MRAAFSEIRKQSNFRAAIIAPIAIMLIFSFFNLSAAPDQSRLSNAITLGVVNHDSGLTFPPITISNLILGGMSENMRFQQASFEEDDAARYALEAGEISAAIIFPENFSKNTANGEPVEITVLNTQHLSMMESSLTGQLPMLMQAALSAAVSTVRDSLAKGDYLPAVFR